MNLTPEIILASSSPRRKQLLTMIGWKIQVFEPNILEEKNSSETILEYIQRNAREKAEQIALAHVTHLPILAADTIVLFQGKLLEKPRDRAEAKEMLTSLSNQTHKVWTAFHCIVPSGDKFHHCKGLVESGVTFRELHPSEIDAYVATDSPLDKSGSYGIQDDIGAGFVKKIEGSYTNVVGLPLAEVIESLRSVLK